jgi:AraC family transcriptional regulator
LLSPNISTSDPLRNALRRKERDGAPGSNISRVLAESDDWRVLDIVCTAGPPDRPFEERHAWASISMVMAGTFAYRSEHGSSLMSSGALLLGNMGAGFECSHQHGAGDRCISFQFTPAMLESIAGDAGSRCAVFHHGRLPALRALAPLTARVTMAMNQPSVFEEIALELAGAVIQLDRSSGRGSTMIAARDHGRIADVIQHLEKRVAEAHTLESLASIAEFSRYHFLRIFRRVTGVTPHQWILRARLREAAKLVVTTREPITEIALDVGFEDLSNFIRSFRAEFGVSPRIYRATMS